MDFGFIFICSFIHPLKIFFHMASKIYYSYLYMFTDSFIVQYYNRHFLFQNFLSKAF